MSLRSSGLRLPYRDLLGEHCRAAEVAVSAWCLMQNQVYLALVPQG